MKQEKKKYHVDQNVVNVLIESGKVKELPFLPKRVVYAGRLYGTAYTVNKDTYALIMKAYEEVLSAKKKADKVKKVASKKATVGKPTVAGKKGKVKGKGRK